VCGLCLEGGRCDLVPDAIYFPPVASAHKENPAYLYLSKVEVEGG
jgi:hypothetical protein